MFVSYSHDDKAAVEQEITALAGRGIRVYYDEGIYPGHAWHEDLAHAVADRGCCSFAARLQKLS